MVKLILDADAAIKLSIEKLAELLGVDLYTAHEILEKYHVKSSIRYSRFVKGISNAEVI